MKEVIQKLSKDYKMSVSKKKKKKSVGVIFNNYHIAVNAVKFHYG